jgi:hypothetical protein
LFGERMVAMDDVWVKGELYRLSHELRARANAEHTYLFTERTRISQ